LKVVEPLADRLRLSDFTEKGYSALVDLAVESNRKIARYDSIPWDRDFLLWRHDIDYSINRSHRIAQINSKKGLHSTFFVNIHSSFYNPFELSQTRLLREIFASGHDVGVHFDWSYYCDSDRNDLDDCISREAEVISDIVRKTPVAVSFHNPTQEILEIDSVKLGGLANAYSRQLMEGAEYCSDSNGYWRYRRLADVLADSAVARLQVLTHPGWWQEGEMVPRHRVERAVSGRAAATMADYDRALRDFGRENFGDVPSPTGI
jgi:hypothetical protein